MLGNADADADGDADPGVLILQILKAFDFERLA